MLQSEQANPNRTPISLFVYFSFNYPPYFIEECWKDNTSLFLHLREKFNMIYKKRGSNAVFNNFFVELSLNNQTKLENYILSTFKG